MSNPNDLLHPDISEDVFQTRITDLCNWLHLKWHHETDSRRTRKGWPDLVIAGPSGVIFAELKKRGGKPTTEQAQWLETLRAAGAEVYLWRPADWPAITARLGQLARPRPSPRPQDR